VIANNAYGSLTPLSPLSNSENGGQGMRDALAERGFTVTLLVNKKAEEMKHAIQAFVQVVKDLKKPCDSFFYFSGHGMEQGGLSYLMPVDYTSPATGKEKDNDTAVDLEERLLSKLNGASCPDTMNIIMLDCCREDEENPIYRNAFGSSCTGSYGGNHECYRSAGHCAPESSQFIVAFGSAPGTVNLEFEKDEFGVFTGKFLEVLKESNGRSEEFHEIFRQVTVKVSNESKGRMEPWYNAGGLKRQFYFGNKQATQVYIQKHASSFKCLMSASITAEFYSQGTASEGRGGKAACRERGKKTDRFGYFQFQHPRRN
jgi:uncharacterized caspase-like protein